ncbi:MAG TPA: NAD-dependent epimerase/dehydratase family protein [Aestuariivirgaceae bacterium]|nr:NAD-dependent epimerase/dehydratase family protein [Aestuariivirgaceae bacterium]
MTGPIALTGATGFVGRRILALCGEAGVAVRALARRPAALEGEPKANLEIIPGDLLDDTALAKLTKGAQAIIHCAGAIAGAPETLAAANVEGTRRLATAARHAGTLRFVHVSSLAAREPSLSGYALTKRLGEREVIDGLPRDRWVILRPPVIYGPGDRATLPLIEQFTKATAWLPGSRRQRFSLLYVDDLARALLHLAQSREPTGQIHELDDGCAQGHGWGDIAAVAVAAEGRPQRVHYLPRLMLASVARLSQSWVRLGGRQIGPPLSPGKVRELYHRDWVCRNRLLDAATDWRANMDFEDGFGRTLAWYRQNGWLPAGDSGAKTPGLSGDGVRPG